ncbi:MULTISPECIES: hypothetical protein [Moraxella]|uniref:Uncharacterized protein n=1 Tax=Moraxella catarrhalis TaxID=480 RepID=A0A7Z1A433_MORCA|nr:hypothetical protein [Moraxella catarrhalis]OAV01192.1 hypothetical protein AO382_0949 [Moraxella catarrhalis]STY81546.1 Uncharacterised protein [Moraxella catarrhalis]
MGVYSQYPLVLDAAFVPTRTGWYLWMSTIVLVLLICLAVGLSWWQWVSLGVCVGVLIGFYAYHQRLGIRQMSSRQIDGVWLLSFPVRSKQAATTQDDPKDTHVIHQAYLHHIRLVNLGISSAVVMDFYAISPKKQPMTVVIFNDQTDPHNFSKLSALARLYQK